MRIANNLPALTAYKELNATNNALAKSVQNLTTGLRINSSDDDAAGFAISQRMRSQISGLDNAIQSTQDGISLLQTAEGAISQTNSMLMRMRELSVQASNDSLTSQDRQFLQLEINELRDQINRIADTTQFNNKRILDGSSGAMWSSSDLGLKATINKGLISVDDFGQKVNHEGNYKIQINADPGQGQIQKSNIMTTAFDGVYVEMQTLTEPITQTVYEVSLVTETVTETVTELQRVEEITPITETQTVPHIIRINEGVDSINETSGDGWKFENGQLVITGSGTYDIRGTQGAVASTTPPIIIQSGANAKIFLTDVNIDKSATGSSRSRAGDPALKIEAGATASIYLDGNNTLKGGSARAGLEVGYGATLNLSSAGGDGSTRGTLNSTGGDFGAAGIGGSGVPTRMGRAGTINISGGTITARGMTGGAGIGGGNTSGPDGGGTITITGGNVTAWGSANIGGAGIGSGYYASADTTAQNNSAGLHSDNTKINIFGGTVRAYGGASSAGIGGSAKSGAGTITINKDLIENGDVVAASGGTGAEQIGYGAYGNNADNNINLEANESVTYNNAPERPTITAEVEVGQTSKIVYKEVTTTIERQVTREVTKQVDKVIGTKVVDQIPIIHGYYDEDFVYQPKKLSEISQFYTSDGAFKVSNTQTITITQGNGKTASVNLYPGDTIKDVADRINDAIANDLGQAAYTDNNNNFCTLSDGTANSSESVYERKPVYAPKGYLAEYIDGGIPEGTLIGYEITSTMLVRSAIPGKDGELYFSGDDDILNALGLNTIQNSSESTFTANVYNAHTGQPIATNVKATESAFVSLIPPDVDISVDPMAGVSANWDDTTKRFIWARKENYEAMIHLKNNGIAFQTGANSGEDFMIDLGDMSTEALDLSGVNLTTRESASRSIGVIDRAIKKVSSQRAKIGAYENALENTMNNLKTTSLNITAAESRIRDADMAKEMMDFVKYQILNQTGTSMLAQANQLPSSVQSLFQQ